ncbi:hypothetical protein RFI_15400, partial [Reticulomyxa filosa]
AKINWTANTFTNPSMFIHKGVVADKSNGVATLLDPKYFDLVAGQAKHLTRYEFERKKLEGWVEKTNYSEFVWYGQHHKVNFHYDWSLAIDTIAYKHLYVITTPFEVPSGESFISQHNISNGIYSAVATVPFAALDLCVTEAGRIFAVGFQFRKSDDSFYLFQRHALVTVLNAQGNNSLCGGCRTMYYGSDCSYLCDCEVKLIINTNK